MIKGINRLTCRNQECLVLSLMLTQVQDLGSVSLHSSPVVSFSSSDGDEAEKLIKEKELKAIIGMERWREATLVPDIGNRVQVLVLSLAEPAIKPPLMPKILIDLQCCCRRCNHTSESIKIVEFTQPYAESGLSMIVPVKSEESAWMFKRPFTWTIHSSMLTVKRLKPSVADIERLKRNNSKVDCDGDSFVRKYLENVLDFKSDNILNVSSEFKYQGEFETTA
ncbi:hypothetical protein Dsin_021076 [Dipteronia sinensis]|uniref:Uncharacterized protein n=1 Tax=Dipteronia sinensis TaxID=43782 RepID=A0AAE0AAH5_9ROSI|nr:hypothetical protein Dsin_021076 [Dipteronia sinensis]